MLDLQTKLQLLQTDPNFAVYLLTGPQPEDQFLSQQLGRDYIKYMDMRRDPHVRSVLQKRRQAILGRNMLIESNSKKRSDLSAIDTAQAILDKISYERLCSSLLNTGQLIGFSVLSIDYDRDGDLIIPKTTFIPQNRFVFAYYHPEDTNVPCAGDEPLDPETEIVMVGGFELRLLTRRNPILGERCPKGRFLVYTFDGDNNSPWGLGLGYSIYPWWSIKREATMAMVMQSDRLGSPPVIGTHPPEIDPRDPEKAALLKAFEDFLKSISPNGWAKLPDGFNAKVVEGIASASPEQQATLIALADAQISKAVLGEISFSDKPVGGYAANESQIQDRESSITDGDCNVLDEQINEGLWETLAELNYPAAQAPIVRRETTADQRKAELKQQQEAQKLAIAQRDSVLIQQAGLRPSDKYVADTYGPEWSVAQLPTPVGGEPGANPETNGKQPAPINLSEPINYGALIHQVLPWNGLDIGVEFHPGEVRFPGRKFSQRLRSGYGHIRNHRDETDEAPDCYIYHGLLDKENPQGSDRIWEVRQLNPKTGEHDEPKHMIGYWSSEDAQTAYLREMPPEFYGGIREITPAHMERYRMDKPYAFSAAQPRDANGRWAKKGSIGQLASEGTHLAVHVAENVVAWKAGKVIGGAIGAIAASHGVNPETAKLVGETAVQAIAATIIHARNPAHRGASAKDLGAHFIAEAAAAAMGKLSHGEAEGVAAALGGDEHVKQISALIAGKGAGLGTNVWANRSGIAASIAGQLSSQTSRLKAIVQRGSTLSFAESLDYTDPGDDLRLTRSDESAIYDLAIAGYVLASYAPMEGPLDHAEPDPEELDKVYAAYHQAVNMSASELEKWAETEAAKHASLDSSPITRNLELLRTPKSQWTQKHIAWANRTIGFISRMKGMPKGKPVSEDVPYSKRDISLKNWAFDPAKKSFNHAEAIVVAEADDDILDEQAWAKLAKVNKPVIRDAMETIATPKQGESQDAK